MLVIYRWGHTEVSFPPKIIRVNAFENAICKLASILYQTQWVNIYIHI